MRDEHFEVVSSNKAKEYEKQKNNQKDDIEDEEYISISFKDL